MGSRYIYDTPFFEKFDVSGPHNLRHHVISDGSSSSSLTSIGLEYELIYSFEYLLVSKDN